MSAPGLESFVASAETAARSAGLVILNALAEAANTEMQVKSGVDLVTETDKAAENLIIEHLKKDFPDHSFMGEESTYAGEESASGLGSEPTWVIDPLDGTTNFVHAYPCFCVSIALAIDKEPVVGVIFNPLVEEMYTASKGRGAFLNGREIQVRAPASLGDALVVNNIGASREEGFIQTTLGRLAELLRRGVQGVRNSGSAAMNMAHVACGKVDCYYEDGYGGPWDVAAGLVIVREAGGVVRGLSDEPFALGPGKGKVVCGHEAVVSQVCEAIGVADRAAEDGSGAKVGPGVAV